MSHSVSLPLVLPLSPTFNIIVIGHLSHATSILIGLFGFGISYHLLIFPILFIPHIKQQLLCYLWDHFLLQFDSTNTCTFHFHCPCNSCIATYFFFLLGYPMRWRLTLNTPFKSGLSLLYPFPPVCC